MKFISYRDSSSKKPRAGLWINQKGYDLEAAAAAAGKNLPSSMLEFLELGPAAMDTARGVEEAIQKGRYDKALTVSKNDLLSPVPRPPSCRDGYAFRQHVAAARRNRGAEMVAEFDQFPIFYFTNHNAILGGGAVPVEQDHLERLDFELEAAIILGRGGRNISSKDADTYIAGYTIMNDFSARRLQMEEMLLSLGPAKGKDFATTLGPWLVTPDELSASVRPGEFGLRHHLRMLARHNGKQVSEGNLSDMNWTFAEIIERASYGTDLFPGDVIGSGTVGTGCYMELNGTWAREAKERGETFSPVWLKDGDTIELEIEGIGVLQNTIALQSPPRSILAKKKNV